MPPLSSAVESVAHLDGSRLVLDGHLAVAGDIGRVAPE